MRVTAHLATEDRDQGQSQCWGPRDAGIWPAIHTGRVDRQCSHALARTLAHTHTLGWRQCVTGGEKHGRPGVGGFELESLCHSHSRWPTCQTSIHLPPAASPRRMAICSHGSRTIPVVNRPLPSSLAQPSRDHRNRDTPLHPSYKKWLTASSALQGEKGGKEKKKC